jgi:hypothetical protein
MAMTMMKRTIHNLHHRQRKRELFKLDLLKLLNGKEGTQIDSDLQVLQKIHPDIILRSLLIKCFKRRIGKYLIQFLNLIQKK